MDQHPQTRPTDAEIERQLKIEAVEAARRDPRPSVPNDQVCAEMRRMIEEIDKRLRSLPEPR